MKKLLLILLCLPFIGLGQRWEKTLGDTEWDKGYSVQQTSDGGYIITGCTEPIGGNGLDIYLIKTDEFGNEEWTKTFGGLDNDEGYSIQQTTDGGYIITGYTSSFGNYRDVYLVKTDGNGNEQWSQTFGGSYEEVGFSVQQTTDGGYIITGYTTETVNFIGVDVYLIKTDGNGNEQWSQTFGGTNSYHQGKSVQQTSDAGYIILGTLEINGGNGNGKGDIYLIKTDMNGNAQWNKTFGGTYSREQGESVQQTSDGGYIICGESSNTDSLVVGDEVCLIKTDMNGDSLWARTFGGLSADSRGNSVQQTIDGGYIIVGMKEDYFGNSGSDVYLIKTDGNGNEQWNKTFGGTEEDDGYSVQQTSDGGYIITGSKEDEFGNEDIDVYLIKTDTNGNVTSTFNIPTPNSNRKLDKTVDILGREKKEKKNEPLLYLYDDGTVEKRITID